MQIRRAAPIRIRIAWVLLLILLSQALFVSAAGSTSEELTQPGDSLASIAIRTGTDVVELGAVNRVIHPLWPYPVAGTPALLVPALRPAIPSGRWHSLTGGSLPIVAALETTSSPWAIAWGNGLGNPWHPLASRIFVPGEGAPPSHLPPPLAGIHISPLPAVSGQAMQVRVWTTKSVSLTGDLEGHQLRFSPDGDSQVALLGLGGFVEPADYQLNLSAEQVNWASLVRTTKPNYGLEEIWLSGETQQYLDAEAIRAEQARLNDFFANYYPERRWNGPWGIPLVGEYTITSEYGTRRSYNGGPAQSYHEGVDFRGEIGRSVIAPADGLVVLSELLYVRGNAIVVDHGLGVYSGYYHLSKRDVQEGQLISAGHLLGEVGSTGLSTGSHLHWDVVVAGVNVDGIAWQHLTAAW